VGVGYSYAEDESVLVKINWEAVADLTKLLKALVMDLPTLQSSPLFLIGESYSGKLATMTGVCMARAIYAGTLKITLGGSYK
jgi:serine carboxypeptidase 1